MYKKEFEEKREELIMLSLIEKDVPTWSKEKDYAIAIMEYVMKNNYNSLINFLMINPDY